MTSSANAARTANTTRVPVGLLELLDTESMLQLGMVADASEIVLRFVRFLDKECFDISALPDHIHVLQASATDLFVRAGCLNHAGYTRHMLGLIRRPRLVLLSGGRPKTLGDINGPNDSIVARCLGRMANWWSLADAVLRAGRSFLTGTCFFNFLRSMSRGI